MTKEEKAKAIIDRLILNSEHWVTCDTTQAGKLMFKVVGLKDSITILTGEGVTTASRTIAWRTMQAGLTYGNCQRILQEEVEEQKTRKQNNLELSSLMSDAINEAEVRRINLLTESEAIEDIQKKYGIKVISYEKV